MIVGLRMHLTYGSHSAQGIPSRRTRCGRNTVLRTAARVRVRAECNVAAGYGHVS